MADSSSTPANGFHFRNICLGNDRVAKKAAPDTRFGAADHALRIRSIIQQLLLACLEFIGPNTFFTEELDGYLVIGNDHVGAGIAFRNPG